jgi:hypothetical protein
MRLEGVRSVRIDDCKLGRIQLIESSVNLFNCRHDGGLHPWIFVDSKSSLVAYEHRYNSHPTDRIFVNSISYDGTQDIAGDEWNGTSVWGPLRAVTATKGNILVTDHFHNATVWDDYNTNTYAFTSLPFPPCVLGNASNRLYLGLNTEVWSKHIIATIPSPGYCVWSIHTHLESEVEAEQFYGEIVTNLAEGQKLLGHVYFKQNQWVCSYGMKYIKSGSFPLNMRLAFKTFNAEVLFLITDYQVVMFDDLASANSFVNSREFAVRERRE